MSDNSRTTAERLAVMEDSVRKLEVRADADGERIWSAIDKLRSCVMASNRELREHLDEKFHFMYSLTIRGGGFIAALLLGTVGFLFVKIMGW